MTGTSSSSGASPKASRMKDWNWPRAWTVNCPGPNSAAWLRPLRFFWAGGLAAATAPSRTTVEGL
eukprot:9503634-Lingulodinium_polyedra.AAC.1